MTIVGRRGGAFNIEGENFGEKGVLVIGERHIATTMWSDTRIKGQFPEDLQPGKVLIKTVDPVSDKVVKEQTLMYGIPSVPLAAATK